MAQTLDNTLKFNNTGLILYIQTKVQIQLNNPLVHLIRHAM